MKKTQREKQHYNTYKALTEETKEQLRVSILELAREIVFAKRPKTAPSLKFIEQTLSEDIRRLVAKLDDGLQHRYFYKEYVVIYFGLQTEGKQEYFIHKISTETIVELKRLIEEKKPEWAIRASAYPIAYKIPEDDYYPFEIVWPVMENYKERSRDSIRLTGSGDGIHRPRKKNVSTNNKNPKV